MGYITKLENIPGSALIKTAQDNNNFTFSLSSVTLDYSWVSVPVSYDWGAASVTKSTTLTIEVNAPPYIQTLTTTVTGTQTVQHDHPNGIGPDFELAT